MSNIEYRFKPQGKVLKQYMASRTRVTAIMGPLGSGKTYGSCQRMFTHICTQAPNRQGVRKSRWVAVRNTYPDLMSTTIKDWREMFDSFDDPRQKLGKFTMDFPPTHHLNFKLPDNTRVEAEVVFLALDRPDSVRKLRGLQATGFWLNEMKELDKEIVDMCDLRHGRYPSKADGGASWHGMIGDTNAPDDDHWYFKMAEEERPDGWTFLRQAGGVIKEFGKWIPNPDAENLNNLPEGYYERGMAGKSDDWIKVNLGNEYGSIISGKPIYEGQWNDRIHVSEFPLVPARVSPQFIMGWDFGLTPACILGQIMPTGQLRILKELCAERMGVESFAQEVVLPYLNITFRRYGINVDDIPAYCDPSGTSGDTDAGDRSDITKLIDLGFDAMPIGSNNPEHRWDAVRHFLTRLVSGGRPAFLLCPDAKQLRKGFNGGYQFKRLNVSGEKRYHQKADKNMYSHPHDALQYLCQGAVNLIDNSFATPPSNYEGRRVADSSTGY